MHIRYRRLAALLVPILFLSHACFQPASAAEPDKLHAGEWQIKMPAKAYKDLPALMTAREVTSGASLGNIVFVCDRNRYYILLVSPFFKYRPAQEGRISLGGI